MLVFPNAKINIGLNILFKREDGFHEIETLFYPIGLSDSLEFIKSEKLSFQNLGIDVDCSMDDNLIVKAYRLVQAKYNLPPIEIALLKNIPFGAGLGGGSADASFMIKALNDFFQLQMNDDEMCEISLQIGSDCPFFIKNRPMIGMGRGEVLHDFSLSLKGKFLVLINPGIHVGTKEAYSGVKPGAPAYDLKLTLQEPIETWKHKVVNKFEESVFPLFPEIREIKESLYNNGALYASMSGSGSSVYGIFNTEIATNNYSKYFRWSGYLE